MALVIGAGKMGRAIYHDMKRQGIETRICDAVPHNIDDFFTLDVRDEDAVRKEIRNEDVVISAIPYNFNYMLAKIAVEEGTNFLDLGGNTDIVMKELELDNEARKKGITIIPDCGLAPGMMNVIASMLAEESREVHIRVGGIPEKPVGPFGYSAVFSIHGLINEYVEDAIIVRKGKIKKVSSLDGLETIFFEGFGEMEAFYTHGGTSTMPFTLKLEELDYKTVRYKGHCEKMRFLKEHGFFDEGVREYTEKALERILPEARDAVVARVYGENGGMEMVDLHDGIFSAMARTTGFSTAIMAGMVINGMVDAGAFPPEIAIDGNRFIEELNKRDIRWRKV